MSETGTNWIDFWISLAGVAETAIWAIVLAVLVVRFRKPLSSVVGSISERVERGDTVDLFGLKLEAARATAALEEKIEGQVREALNAADTSTEEKKQELGDQIISRIRREAFLTIDFTAVRSIPDQHVSYAQFENVGLLLRYIWIEAGIFQVHSYGRLWVIKNERNGAVLHDIGSRYARRVLGTKWDERSLAEVNILVGDRISVHRTDGSP